MKNTLILLGLAAAFVASPALANDKHAGSDHYFAKIDTNSDGFISKAEQDAFGNKKFAEMDANGDGKLSKAEVDAHKAKWKKEHGSDSNLHDEDSPYATQNKNNPEKPTPSK